MNYHNRQRIAEIGRVLDVTRRVVLGLLFWGIVLLLLFSVLPVRRTVRIDTLLVVSPRGELVDSYTRPMNYRGIPVSGYPDETLLSDLVGALDNAALDPRITGAWIKLDEMTGGGTAAAGELAEAVIRFQSSGKKTVASADTYDNARYRIASSSDHIIVDRLGEVFPAGFGSWRAYFAEGLDKLGAEVDLFRSGESKTAAETYTLSGMSDTARRDEERLLGDLWDIWLEETADARGIDKTALSTWISEYDRNLISSGGDGSRAAEEAGLVDSIETGGVLEGILEEYFGYQRERRIDAVDYAAAAGSRAVNTPRIAVVPVSGVLVYGEGGTGMAGSRNVADAVRAARDTRGVEALVLRIDSPGGDVRAGEEIRRVLEETRNRWNLPVVASLGNLAASGGYWIAVESDLIVTRSDTITGSIGVYSLSVSFEKALSEWLGIRIDGVGTTPWSAMGHPGRSLSAREAAIYAAGVADIDGLFRSLVSERRNLAPEELDSLAGGIPWSGRRALETGLADLNGGLSDAVSAAAGLAGLEEWNTVYFEPGEDPRTELLGRILFGYRKRPGVRLIR